jgi:hypothetical protein
VADVACSDTKARSGRGRIQGRLRATSSSIETTCAN